MFDFGSLTLLFGGVLFMIAVTKPFEYVECAPLFQQIMPLHLK